MWIKQPIARIVPLAALLVIPHVAAAAQQPAGEDAVTARTLALVDQKLLAHKTAEARDLVRPLEALANRDAFVALTLGRVREQQGDYQDALRYLKKAAELSPSDPAALLSLGEVNLLMDHDWNAAVAFKEAYHLAQEKVSSHPKDANAHYLLGLAEQRLQHYDQALESFQKTLSLDPSNVMARYQVGVTRTFQKRWQEAIDALTAAIDDDPDLAYAYYYRGIAADALGKKDLVIGNMKRFLEMAPTAPEAHEAEETLTAALQ